MGVRIAMPRVSHAQAFREAALRAQELLALARAVEARVSALTPDTLESVVEETAVLVRATALQTAGTVHELLIAVSGCVAAFEPPGAISRDEKDPVR